MEALKPYLFYFMRECGVCCCFGFGLIPAVFRIMSIPGLQNHKRFTLELLRLNSPTKFYNLSVSPCHHQGTESVMNRV